MDIKNFIKESLLQIVDGITETNETLVAKGASIPTTKVAGEGVWWTLEKDGKNQQGQEKQRKTLNAIFYVGLK